jgi:hypothetical protein
VVTSRRDEPMYEPEQRRCWAGGTDPPGQRPCEDGRVKLGNPANYYVQVWPSWWDEPEETVPLYRDIFTLSLNAAVTVKFVPDIGGAAPPWRLPESEPATATEVRVTEALTAAIAVTPNAALAGGADTFVLTPGEPPNTVLYVTTEEFLTYRDELAVLAESACEAVPAVRHDDIAHLNVVRFLDEQVLRDVSGDVVARADGRTRS